MIAGVGSEVEVNWRIKTCLGSRPGEFGFKKFRFGEPEVIDTNILVGFLLFTVILLSCAIVLLEAKSISGLLETAKSHLRFL